VKRLSVCIPTYNGSDYLLMCLESVLAQQGVDLQVIVGDDASTDATVALANSIDHPALEVHSFPERLGLAGNWNRTCALADGDYFSLVGQDDRVDGHWAARLVGLLEEHPEANLAFGRRRFEFADEESRKVVGDFFENRYPKMLEPFYSSIGTIIEPSQMIAAAMGHCFEINLIGEPSFVMIRRSAAGFAEGFDESMRQMIDWEFFTRMFVDRPILHCPEPVGTYHIHARASSIENAPLSKHYREYDYLLGKTLQRFAGHLSSAQESALQERRDQVRDLAKEWAEREAQENGPQEGPPTA
jgi:glycosyltransferase involved in cell wall biosynthesis